FGERLGEGIERTGYVVLVFVRSFGMVVDLNFVTVVDGHPFFARLDGNADEDAGVVIEVAHFVDDAEFAMADLAAGPVGEAHAAVGLDQAVFDGNATGTDVLPAGEILAVEELFPFAGLGARGMNGAENGKSSDKKCCERRD